MIKWLKFENTVLVPLLSHSPAFPARITPFLMISLYASTHCGLSARKTTLSSDSGGESERAGVVRCLPSHLQDASFLISLVTFLCRFTLFFLLYLSGWDLLRFDAGLPCLVDVLLAGPTNLRTSSTSTNQSSAALGMLYPASKPGLRVISSQCALRLGRRHMASSRAKYLGILDFEATCADTRAPTWDVEKQEVSLQNDANSHVAMLLNHGPDHRVPYAALQHKNPHH